MRELESLSYSRSVITVCLSISGWINLYLSTIFVDQCLYSIGSTTVISTGGDWGFRVGIGFLRSFTC